MGRVRKREEIKLDKLLGIYYDDHNAYIHGLRGDVQIEFIVPLKKVKGES